MEHSQFFVGLRKLFEKFPGIGPRQANRFIWAMLDFSPDEQKVLGETILALQSRMRRCDVCFRVFPVSDSETLCSFCLPSSKRDRALLMVVEHDSDLLNVEKSGIYHGLYHVTGGTLDPLQEYSVVRERIKALYERIKTLGVEEEQSDGNTPGVKKFTRNIITNLEIILALSPTKMGEFTAQYIKKVLEPLLSGRTAKLNITRLGRGLATGMELEYADELTLKQALDNRK
ncbi:MAG TPA: toprim domain-containing protein [Candidatus Paceibacterota bacterium]